MYYIYKMLPDHVAMCHGFCWAAHLDAVRCVFRSLRNKLARVGNNSLFTAETSITDCSTVYDDRSAFTLDSFCSPLYLFDFFIALFLFNVRVGSQHISAGCAAGCSVMLKATSDPLNTSTSSTRCHFLHQPIFQNTDHVTTRHVTSSFKKRRCVRH